MLYAGSSSTASTLTPPSVTFRSGSRSMAQSKQNTQFPEAVETIWFTFHSSKARGSPGWGAVQERSPPWMRE